MTERRRAKGEGTVRERSDGLWEAREPPEIVPFGEKPRSFYGKSKSEVVRKLREALRERERGFSPSVDRITVGEYLERWIEGPLRESVSEKTYDDYAWVCRKYLIPEIGRAKLKNLTVEHLDDLYARKVREGLSPRTVAYIHATIRVALQRAVKKRLIPFNVARDADPPSKSAAGEDEKLTLSGRELAAFFKAAAEAEDRFEALFIIGALAGPRPQELLGLNRPDLTLPEAPGSPGEMQLLRRVSMSSEGLKIVEGLKGGRARKRSAEPSTSCPRPSPH
jgi:integrase